MAATPEAYPCPAAVRVHGPGWHTLADGIRRVMRRTIASVLAAGVALTAVSACSGSKPKTRPVAVTSSPVVPVAVTPDTAAKAFTSFVANDDVARAAGDERLALSWTTDGQTALTVAAFRQAVAGGVPVPRYRYDSPVYYVPKLRAEDRQWFVVRAKRSTAAGKDPKTALMGFVQAKPGGRWRLSLLTMLAGKQKPPKVAVGTDGYATPLATFDARLVIQPRLVPAIQATLAEEGPSSVAARAMKTGAFTTDYYTADQKAAKKKPKGVHYNVVYTATQYPIFPLATTDGGGLVLYALSRDAATTKSKKKPGRLPVPKDVSPLIGKRFGDDSIDVFDIQQYAALDPLTAKKGAPPAKATVIGYDGASTRVSAPPRVPPTG